MKFLKSINELSIKQRAILGTVKCIAFLIAAASVGIMLTQIFGFFITIATIALAFIFTIVYQFNVHMIESDIEDTRRQKEFTELREKQIKFLSEGTQL